MIMVKKCVFAGSFDPPTLGHKAVVDEALKVFDEVIVALLVNPQKKPFFTVEEKLAMLALDYGENERVRVVTFTGTVAELMQEENACAYVRGIRNATDLDFENANFYASRKLDGKLTAVYVPCPQELLHVSSSMVRNSIAFGTDFGEYVTERVQASIREKR